MEAQNTVINLNSRKQPTSEEALLNLYTIFETYMALHPNLSVNHLSKKCGVNEPTLRRIKNRQLKRLPSTTNLLKVLSYISKKDNIADVVSFFPGALIDFIHESILQAMKSDLSNVIDLTQQLSDPTDYLIYKLAANNSGVSRERVLKLFGLIGEQHLNRLISKDLITEENHVCYAKHQKFCLAPESFKKNFKATADFIKPEKLNNAPYKQSQVFYNISGSVDMNTYIKILKIQRSAVRKMRDLIFDDSSDGNIPVFMIGAVDTLDNDCAFEINKSNKH